MPVNGIPTKPTAGITLYGVTSENNSSHQKAGQLAQGSQPPDSPAVVEISEKGKMLLAEGKRLEEKMSGSEMGNSKIEEFLKETSTAREEWQNFQRAEVDPFDNLFQIMGVSYTFLEGTVQDFISKKLDGKVRNPSLVASELGKMINGQRNGSTVEERAVTREIGLKNIEYIAQNYFDNPDEAQALIDGVKKFSEKAILAEKGYTVIANSDIPPFKSYAGPDGRIGLDSYAQKYGAPIDELSADPGKWQAFISAVASNQSKWDQEIISAFNANEKNVANIISGAKNLVTETAVNNSMQRLLKAF